MSRSPGFPTACREARDSPRDGGVILTQNLQADNLMDIDELADRLALSDLPPDDKDEQWRGLLFGVVLPRAQRLETELNCHALVNKVLEVLPYRLRSYRQTRGRFRAWLERLLRNLARDEMRGLRRFSPLTPANDEDPRSRKNQEPETPSHEDRTLQLQQALNELTEAPISSRQRTDFLGMLLVSLRLAVVARLKRSRKALAVWNETRTERAEQQFPWSADDAARQLQQGWPRLDQVWRRLANGLEASGKNPTDDRIVELLTAERRVGTLNAEMWRQWRKRAIAWAIRWLGLDRWQTEVEPWLETRAPRRGQRLILR